MEFQGPCGGFEYSSNALEELTLLTAGGAVTPALQIVRTIVNDPKDKTRCNLIYYSNTYEEILFKDELEKYNGKLGFYLSLAIILVENMQYTFFQEMYSTINFLSQRIRGSTFASPLEKLLLAGQERKVSLTKP